MAVFGFDAKVNESRTIRSLAVNAKNAVVSARGDLLKEDSYNNKYLHGDTLGNIGINDLIWYWLYERGLEGGNNYIRPFLDSSLSHWRTDYNEVMISSLEPTGDRHPFGYGWWTNEVPDARYLNGFYPPNFNGVAAEELNFATDYLNWNGDTRAPDNTWGHGTQGDSSGFLFHLWALYETLGDSQTTPDDSIVSGYIYADAAAATIAAKQYLYGDSVGPGTQVGKTKLGWGVIGRRSADVNISTNQSGLWRYVIGNDAIDQPNYWGDSTGDVNSFLDTIPFDSNLLTTLYAVCQFGDSNGVYSTHLRALETELAKIEGDSNPLFSDPDIVAEIGDTSGAINDLLTTIGTIIGDSGDTYYAGGDTTLWGFYSFFSDAGTDGTEGIMDVALLKAKEFGDSLRATITNRYDNYINAIGDTFVTDETDFTGARKWRSFWVKTRIFKPKSTLLSYDALGSSITDSEKQVANANEQLRTLYGDSDYHHYSYILTPLMLAAFYDPKLDQDTGAVLEKKITSVFDGQQHATQYRIYRQKYTSAGATSITNTVWGDTYYYDTLKTINEDSGFVITEYTDTGRIAYEGDSIQTGEELFLYKDTLISLPNGREGDTVVGISVEPSYFTYIDPIIGDSEQIINPRSRYWHGLDAGGASGLVAYYPLNGNARDYSGKGHHGIINESNGVYETGFIEEGYHFYGDSDSIKMGDSYGDSLTTWSLSAWVKGDTIAATFQRIVEGRNTSNNDRFAITIDDIGTSKFYAYAYNAVSGASIVRGNSIITIGEWYHVVGTYDGIGLKLYVDSVLQGDSVVSNLSWVDYNARIGSRANIPGASNIKGIIDEVRFYNRALTQTEVTGIYNTRKMMYPHKTVTGFWKGTTNLINYPDMIGDSVAGDSYNNGNNLWFIHPDSPGDTIELTDYYFGDHRFSKITAITSDGDLKQLLQPGTFGDTVEKSWSMILKKGTGDTTAFHLLTTGVTFYGTYYVYWGTNTTETIIGDTSKTQAEWFTNDIVRFSGTTLPIDDTGDTHMFVIEPQENGTGTVFITAVQLEESTYSTPYVNGTRLKSTYYFTRNMPTSGTLECNVRGRQPFTDATDGNDVFFEWGNSTTERLSLHWHRDEHRLRAYWRNGGVGVNVNAGDTGGDTYYHQWHHIKFIWNFGDTRLDSAKLIVDSIEGDSSNVWSDVPDPYDGVSDVIETFGIGCRFSTTTAHFGGEITDLLIQDTTGDSGDTHYINGVPYFYADPFPNGTNYVYRTQTVDTLNPVQGDTTKSFQSDLFDSSAGMTWNANSGDSILELGDSHDYRPDEYVAINETVNSNGYYLLTRVEDTRIFISPVLATGDRTGKVYPTTSVVFIQE